MNKALTKNKDDNFKCTHADLRLQVEERLKHLLQVHLDYCARHSATCQHLTFTIKCTTQATTTTTTTVLQPLSGTTRVSHYQKKLAATLRWFTAGGAIRIAHDDVITRKL